MGMNAVDRERKIADIIREYSKGDDPDWINNKEDMDNVFKRSFIAIRDYTGDSDLAMWYLSFSQSFGRSTEPMLEKMAEMCTHGGKKLITLKKNFPHGCPYSERSDEVIRSILAIKFNEYKSNEQIIDGIKKCYMPEKFYHGVWCRQEEFEKCEYSDKCPVKEWKDLIDEFNLPFRNEPRVFFYYDTLCLLNNSEISSFNELFSKVNALTDDKTKRTIIIRSLLEQIRGISTKARMFLQVKNISDDIDLDDFELIFVDTHVVRVAERMGFPFYENDLVAAIRKFGERYNLTARQIDVVMWEMGFVCSAKEGCLHGVCGKECIFYDVCSWEDERMIDTPGHPTIRSYCGVSGATHSPHT